MIKMTVSLASDFQPEGQLFEPGLCFRCFFRQETLLQIVSLSSKVYKWVTVTTHNPGR